MSVKFFLIITLCLSFLSSPVAFAQSDEINTESGVTLLPFPQTDEDNIENAIDSPYYTFPIMLIIHPDIAKETIIKWREEGVNYFLGRIVQLLASVIGSLAVLMMSYGGLIMMLSMGNEERYTKGKNFIRYSAIGLVFSLSAYLLVLAVQQIIKGIYA